MSKDKEPLDGPRAAGFVSVVFARSIGEAHRYCALLEDHDIPAMAGSSEDLSEDSEEWKAARLRGMTHGVPVMVPEALLDEAGEVVADLEKTNGFAIGEDDIEDEDDEEFGFSECADSDLSRPLDEGGLFNEDSEAPDETDEEESDQG